MVASYQLPRKEIFSFTTSSSISLNGWLIKPADFDPAKKYPVLLVQYSGPDSQQAADEWKADWEYYLASKGVVVACVDGRGTGARGSEFRKCTYGKLWTIETDDQVETARYFGNQPYVDKSRIGIWGWSFGGSITLSAMQLFAEMGIKLESGKRLLLIPARNFPVEVLFLRDDDIPQSVADGVADVGIVGENEFVEKKKHVYVLHRVKRG